MGNREYQTGAAGKRKGRPFGGPGGPGGFGGGEKPKSLVGSWKKLLLYCEKYLGVLILAIVCAAVGTVLTLAGPDQLSDMTDLITEGITPDTEALEEISTQISEQVSANLEGLAATVTQASQQSMQAAGGAGDITTEMSEEALAGMQAAASASAFAQNSSAFSGELEINGVTVPMEDALAALESLNGLDTEDTEALQAALEELPDSVRAAIYTDLTYEGTVITGEEQQEMIALLSDVDPEDTEATLEALEELPASVRDQIKPSVDLSGVAKIGMLLVLFYGLSYLLSAVQGWIMATVTQKVSREMRSELSDKINRLPMSYYNRNSTGDVLSRVTNDVDTIGQSLNQSIRTLVTSVILFFGSLIMMLITNVWMTLAAVAACIIGFLLMFVIMSRSQKYFVRQQKNLGALNGHIEEMYAGQTVVRAYNGETQSQKTFDRMNDALCDSGFRAQCLSGLMMPIMTFIGNLGYVAVCVVGGAMALNGSVSFGVIVAFMMYVRYFTQPLAQIAQAIQMLQSAAAAGERVFEFLEAEEMEEESGKQTIPLPQRTERGGAVQTIGTAAETEDRVQSNPPAQKGFVEFEHVKFGYEDTDVTVIHDFSAEAKPGQKVAIVGPTGAGKTTLVNLLMRFHEIQGGEIRIDGVSTRDMTREAVHDQFCMVLQDTWLFEGTVRENLVYCQENVSDETVRAACKAVGLDHFIRTLPKGYDTVLNDQVNLSQGQKQQLTIARAMIADKPMLILDEATSSVDTRTEQQIQRAMDALMQNRTSFVIAHRLSTIKNADLILVLKDGDIIESGTHKELLAQNGFYAELYNSQFEQAS